MTASSPVADHLPARPTLPDFARAQTVRRPIRAGLKTISSALAEFQAKWHLPKSIRPRARRPTLDEFSMTISSAVVDLKAKWHTLRDFERAEAILPIIRAGLSRRGLADALNISERGIRRLLLMLEADPIDPGPFPARQDQPERIDPSR